MRSYLNSAGECGIIQTIKLYYERAAVHLFKRRSDIHVGVC